MRRSKEVTSKTWNVPALMDVMPSFTQSSLQGMALYCLSCWAIMLRKAGILLELPFMIILPTWNSPKVVLIRLMLT